MSVLKLAITTGRPSAEIEKLQVPGGKHEVFRKVMNFVEGVDSGCEAGPSGSAPSVAIEVQDAAVQASGTFTLASVIATNTCSVNGVTFTAVSSGATGNQFNVGADNTETASNLAAAITASSTALVSGYVTASSALAVVTVRSAFYGTAGNMTTIASGSGTITASGARLTGGAADPDILTLSY